MTDIYPQKAPGNGRFFVGFAVLLLVATGAFSGCSSSDPEIMQVDMRIIATYSPQSDSVQEHLQVRLDLHDPDGIEEVTVLTVTHEATGLFWRMESSDVRRHSRDGQEWFSFDVLPVPGGAEVPRGSFRVEVEDLSGRLGERSVAIPLNTPSAEKDSFVVIQDGLIRLPADAGNIIGERIYLIRRSPEDRNANEPGIVYELELPDNVKRSMDTDAIPEELRPGAGNIWFLREAGRYLWYRSGPW